MSLNTYVSLFSGAGGLDLGLEKAGWDCRYASDIDSAAVETLQLNRGRPAGEKPVFANAYLGQADVRQLSGSSILAKAELRRGEVTLLAGGPPCQSWSSAGHQLGFEDPRGRLFSDFVRLAGELEVRWLLFENVRGLLTARGSDGKPGSALDHIRSSLLAAGFQTAVSLLNAADFGLPQRRVRLFVVGYRRGDAPPFPEPTHVKTSKFGSFDLKPWNSLRDCLSKLSPIREDEIIRPSGRMAEELAGIRPGCGIKSQGKVESTRPGGHWGYKQGGFVADLDLPARTVTASAQQDWVIDPKWGLRRLCPRECAALQSFPRDWKFAGNRATQYRLIGNAVPMKMAHLVGKSLLAHIDGEKPKQTDSTFKSLLPLSPPLSAAIQYTAKEEARNGASRRVASRRRGLRSEKLQDCLF